MGKRQLGELELSEVVVAVLISDMASHPLQDIGVPLFNGLLPVIVLLCCEILISGAIVSSIRFRALVCGRPSILIENGKIIQSEMKRCRFTVDELAEDLRKKGITDISKVKYAILETDGTLSVLPYASEKPPSAADLKIQVDDFSIPYTIISSGRILEHNLRDSGHDIQWLNAQLSSRNISSPKDVYYMTVDKSERIYILPKEPEK